MPPYPTTMLSGTVTAQSTSNERLPLGRKHGHKLNQRAHGPIRRSPAVVFKRHQISRDGSFVSFASRGVLCQVGNEGRIVVWVKPEQAYNP